MGMLTLHGRPSRKRFTIGIPRTAAATGPNCAETLLGWTFSRDRREGQGMGLTPAAVCPSAGVLPGPSAGRSPLDAPSVTGRRRVGRRTGKAPCGSVFSQGRAGKLVAGRRSGGAGGWNITGVTVLILWLCGRIHPWLAFAAGQTALCYQLLATRSLRDESVRSTWPLRTGPWKRPGGRSP